MRGHEPPFQDASKPHKALLLGRNDEGQLSYCCRYDADPADEHGLGECDVRRMRDALCGHDYEVSIVEQGCQTHGAIGDRLRDAARACSKGDHFLFYFSGHSRTHFTHFSLVLAGGRHLELLPEEEIIAILQQDCVARSKLVILDCCSAEDLTRAHDWQPGRYDDLRFLGSTRSMALGKEVPTLKGGIFTHCLCEALTDPAHWVCDGDHALVDAKGRLYSDKLLRWLKRRIPQVGKEHEPDASFPEPVGDRRWDEPFLVAQVPRDSVRSASAPQPEQLADDARHRPSQDHLAIALRPFHRQDTRRVLVDAMLVNARGDGARVSGLPDTAVPIDRVPRLVGALLRSREVSQPRHGRAGPLHIELFLPVAMLTRDLDELLGCRDMLPPPHAAHHVTTRVLVRLGGDAREAEDFEDVGIAYDWADYWRRCETCLDRPRPIGDDIDCLRAIDDHARCRDELDQGACVLLLGFPPQRSGGEIARMLFAGAAALAWCSRKAPADLRRQLRDRITGMQRHDGRGLCLRDLPSTLRDLRRQCHQDSADAAGKTHTGGYHLIWDDPDRMPKFTWSENTDAPLFVSALDQQPPMQDTDADG